MILRDGRLCEGVNRGETERLLNALPSGDKQAERLRGIHCGEGDRLAILRIDNRILLRQHRLRSNFHNHSSIRLIGLLCRLHGTLGISRGENKQPAPNGIAMLVIGDPIGPLEAAGIHKALNLGTRDHTRILISRVDNFEGRLHLLCQFDGVIRGVGGFGVHCRILSFFYSSSISQF